MSKQTASKIANRVSQHEGQQAIAASASTSQEALLPIPAPAVIDLSEEVEFLKDDMVIEWLFVEWQKQIQRATNTR